MKELKGFLLRTVYLALTCGMFYYANAYLTIGGFGVMYQYLFAIAIILLAFTVFLVRPDSRRMVVALRYSWAFSAHYLWIGLYSMLVWGLSLSRFNVITRGGFAIVYELIGVLAAAATVYLFGREGVRLMVAGLLLANAIYIVRSIAEHGPGPFFQEYIELIVTFTGKTGRIMKSFENLNMSYMLGFFLLYQVMEAILDRGLAKKEIRSASPLKKEWWISPLAVACFLLGLKRSVLLATLVGLMAGLLLSRFPAKAARRAARVLCVLLVVFGFAYVIACYYGVIEWLESLGVDTNGRAYLFEQIKDYYQMGAGYLGKGAGYVSRMMEEGTFVSPPKGGYIPGDIHNDFLRQYIELGFLGYLIWLVLFLSYKAEFFFHGMKTPMDRAHGIMAMTFIVVNYSTFTTENTLYYAKSTMMVSLLIMAYHFEDYCAMEAGYG